VTKLLTSLALAGVAALSFAPSTANAADAACSVKQCIESVTGPIYVDTQNGCVWFDTFPVCVPLV
jgi:hypothetical protein